MVAQPTRVREPILQHDLPLEITKSEPDRPLPRKKRASKLGRSESDLLSPNEISTARRSSRIQESNHIFAKPIAKMPDDGDELICVWPPNGRTEINITAMDLWRFEEGQYLNDTLIEFGLKYLVASADQLSRPLGFPAEDVHVFNSFFYKKISDRDKKGVHDKKAMTPDTAGIWPAYESVKKWTSKVDIFSKKYIIIPINECTHWYLAIIYNPGALLLISNDPPIADVAAADVNAISPSQDVAPDGTNLDAGKEETESKDEVGMTYPKGPSSESPSHSAGGGTQVAADDEMDELALSDDDANASPVLPEATQGNRGRLHAMLQGQLIDGQIADTSIDEMESNWRTSPAPNRIATADTNTEYEPIPVTVPETNPPPREFSVEEPPEEVVMPVRSRVKPSPLVKTTPSETSCVVMTFDSLGSNHPAVTRHLNRWLAYEAHHRKSKNLAYHKDGPAAHYQAPVPTQHNFWDCGVYLLHFVRVFLAKEAEMMSSFYESWKTSGKGKEKDSLLDIYNLHVVAEGRQYWKSIIDDLQKKYWNVQAIKPPPALEADNSLVEMSSQPLIRGGQEDGDSVMSNSVAEEKMDELHAETEVDENLDYGNVSAAQSESPSALRTTSQVISDTDANPMLQEDLGLMAFPPMEVHRTTQRTQTGEGLSPRPARRTAPEASVEDGLKLNLPMPPMPMEIDPYLASVVGSAKDIEFAVEHMDIDDSQGVAMGISGESSVGYKIPDIMLSDPEPMVIESHSPATSLVPKASVRRQTAVFRPEPERVSSEVSNKQSKAEHPRDEIDKIFGTSEASSTPDKTTLRKAPGSYRNKPTTHTQHRVLNSRGTSGVRKGVPNGVLSTVGGDDSDD